MRYESERTHGGGAGLGTVDPRALEEARVVLHHAAVLVAAVGKDLSPPAPDASHKALAYDDVLGSLVGSPITGAVPFRAAIRIPDLTLLLLDAHDEERARLPLVGRTLDAAEAWLNDRLREAWPEMPVSVSRQAYPDLSAHALASGAAVPRLPADHLAELDRYFALAQRVLGRVGEAHPEAGPVRIWPHHFDQALLIPAGTSSGEDAGSVGVGLSPGDASTPEPYWYVTVWPYPREDRLPRGEALGTWQAEPWFGAVLTASAMLAGRDGPSATSEAFVARAVALGRALLAP